MIDDRSRDAYHTAAALLREHLLYGQLRRMDKASQIGRRQHPEVLGRVLGERLRKENPRVVHQGMDRAEPLYRGTNDQFGRRGQTDVAVHQGQPVRALQLVLTTDIARVTHHVIAAIEEQVTHRGTDSLRGSRHDDGLLFRSHIGFPPSAEVVGPGFQSPVCWSALSGCALRLIRWETLESNFQKWQSGPHGEPRRRTDIRQSGPVPEHQPGSPLVGYADLDGEPAVIGAGVEARRVAPETHDATGDPDCAGT